MYFFSPIFASPLIGLVTFTQQDFPNTIELCKTLWRKRSEEGRVSFEREVQNGRKDFFFKVEQAVHTPQYFFFERELDNEEETFRGGRMEMTQISRQTENKQVIALRGV